MALSGQVSVAFSGQRLTFCSSLGRNKSYRGGSFCPSLGRNKSYCRVLVALGKRLHLHKTCTGSAHCTAKNQALTASLAQGLRWQHLLGLKKRMPERANSRSLRANSGGLRANSRSLRANSRSLRAKSKSLRANSRSLRAVLVAFSGQLSAIINRTVESRWLCLAESWWLFLDHVWR